jgi:triosephosphate isomerase
MLIAGNWKMHTDVDAGCALAQGVVAGATDRADALDAVDLAVCPPFTGLAPIADVLDGTPVSLGAQDMHHADEGAYTGEVSAPMLRAVDCAYVILGHSERRQYYGETDADVRRKVHQAHAHGLTPIVCVGETKAERDAGRAEDVVERQLSGALEGVTLDAPGALVVAYEPVWAIGTGDTATPAQAEAMHSFIHEQLSAAYDAATADTTPILYGGSMKPHNAQELLTQTHIGGGLIGSASLDADDFLAIAEAGAAAIAA